MFGNLDGKGQSGYLNSDLIDSRVIALNLHGDIPKTEAPLLKRQTHAKNSMQA